MTNEKANEKANAWLERQGFNEKGYTYCYVAPDSYSRKEELKEAGFKYNPHLGWHRGSNEGYENETVEVHRSVIVEFTAWGEGIYYPNTKDIVAKKAEAILPESTSDYVGTVGERITIEATLSSMRTVNTRFGLNNVFDFNDKDNNVLVWFTTSDKFAGVAEVGRTYSITGTIKKHETYRAVKQTYLSRCIIKEV